jgi:hypothetical protein
MRRGAVMMLVFPAWACGSAPSAADAGLPDAVKQAYYRPCSATASDCPAPPEPSETSEPKSAQPQ